MLAIGNNELGAPVRKGQCVRKGYLRGIVEYGRDEEGTESNLLGFITTDTGSSYLVSIRDRLLEGWEIIHED